MMDLFLGQGTRIARLKAEEIGELRQTGKRMLGPVRFFYQVGARWSASWPPKNNVPCGVCLIIANVDVVYTHRDLVDHADKGYWVEALVIDNQLVIRRIDPLTKLPLD